MIKYSLLFYVLINKYCDMKRQDSMLLDTTRHQSTSGLRIFFTLLEICIIVTSRGIITNGKLY